MAANAGDTHASGLNSVSPTKMSTRSTQNKKPGNTTLRLVNFLAMEIPMSENRPCRLNWHFFSPYSFSVLPPWVTPNKIMTPEQRKTEFVANHRQFGMIKLRVFARLMPGIEKSVACAHANNVVATFERILASDDVVDGLGAYDLTVDRYSDCMEKDMTYEENEAKKAIEWGDPESQSLLDEDNSVRYDENGQKEGEWEWHEEPTDGAKKVPAAKSPAKGKGTGRGGGKTNRGGGSGSNPGSQQGGGNASGSGGGGKKNPGDDDKKKKPAGGKKRNKKSDNSDDSDTGKSVKSGTGTGGKRTPKKKQKTKEKTPPPFADSDSDVSQSIIVSQVSKSGSSVASKAAIVHKSRTSDPVSSSDSDSQVSGRSHGGKTGSDSDDDIGSAAATGITKQPYNIATASRYQKKKLITQDIKCHPQCGCLKLSGEAAVINSISPNLMPCELAHRQMIYQKLLNRGIREKLSKQSKKLKALENRLKNVEGDMKETKDYAKVSAEDKKFETERQQDFEKFGKPCKTFTEFMTLYEEDFDLLKRMFRYVPKSKDGGHFIKEAMEQYFDSCLVCRLYSEKSGNDKVQYTNSGKMFMFGDEYFKIPYAFEVAMQEYAAAEYPKHLKPEDFREKFLKWLESQRKIRKIHVKNYLKAKLSKPGYHAIHSAIWWDSEKRKGIFDSPAPLYDDKDNKAKSEWYARYKPQWLETVQESSSIPDNWKGTYPDYLDSTYTGHRALHAKKPPLEPYWDD